MNGKHSLLKTALFVVALLLVLGGAALAHKPMFEKADTTGFSDTLVIPDAAISHAIYANLDSGSDVDFYGFEVTGPTALRVNLLVPYLPEYRDFYPAYAVVGPDIEGEVLGLPVELPPGYGAVAVKSRDAGVDRDTFYDPLTGSRYYAGFEAYEHAATVPGAYYIVVWHPEGERGAYVVDYGGKEKWTLTEFVDALGLASAIRDYDWALERGPAESAMAAAVGIYSAVEQGAAAGGEDECRLVVVPARVPDPVAMDRGGSGVMLNFFGLSCS